MYILHNIRIKILKQKVFHEYSFSKYVRRKGSPTLLRTCLPNKEDLFLVLQNIA